MVLRYRENKTCFEKSMARALRWGTQGVKSWGHTKKVTVYPNYLKALAMLFSEQVLFSQ